MEKPTLKDFNLTRDDLLEYDKQCERYRQATHEAFEELKNKKKVALIALAIISAITSIIAMI